MNLDLIERIIEMVLRSGGKSAPQVNVFVSSMEPHMPLYFDDRSDQAKDVEQVSKVFKTGSASRKPLFPTPFGDGRVNL